MPRGVRPFFCIGLAGRGDVRPGGSLEERHNFCGNIWSALQLFIILQHRFSRMGRKENTDRWFMRVSRWGLVLFVAFPVLWSACSGSKNEMVKGFDDATEVPTLRTLDVETLISDSGITRYRIKAPEWLIYENAKEPYWYFPRGLHVEKFDSVFATEALIQGDTATYFKTKQLWRLDKNVRIENIKEEVFLTSQIFWDQRKREIYSDSFIHIETPDEVIEGYGFTSNEQMTRYRIRRTSGIFPIKRDSVASDSSRVDSVAPKPVPAVRAKQRKKS